MTPEFVAVTQEARASEAINAIRALVETSLAGSRGLAASSVL